ncbi:MAG: hypothetical protein MI923_07560 [Phycisphaerales bacterium]|nr:hypothetical protein [Phycisphaerales bacterium]
MNGVNNYTHVAAVESQSSWKDFGIFSGLGRSQSRPGFKILWIFVDRGKFHTATQ